MILELQLWVDGSWQCAASFESLGTESEGYHGKIALEYDSDFAVDNLGKGGVHALSCRYPPSFELWIDPTWPAFLLDILPAGAARRSLITRTGLPDSRASDWALLAMAQFPPGNVRVKPQDSTPAIPHKGFSRQEVVTRGPDFVEYAFDRGAPIAGSSGAQGEAPKFLLCEDVSGRWHAEGAVPDNLVANHWLVKFPRGSHTSDTTILKEEAVYMELARAAGINANEELYHEEGCLFIPRFDRVNGDKLGLETIASLSGFSDYGIGQPLQDSAKIIARYTSHPSRELCEFLRRDIFNLAMGNPDNHVRNTSLLKKPGGDRSLSPLYDVAPMILDRSGIARASRWKNREVAGEVDWTGVQSDLQELGAPPDLLRESIKSMAQFVGSLEERMEALQIDEGLQRFLRPKQKDLANQLGRSIQ